VRYGARRMAGGRTINLETGSVIPYQPNTRDQPRDNIEDTCVDACTYAKLTPVRHDLNASVSPITIVGAFQANP
jgi:hypothetical protein